MLGNLIIRKFDGKVIGYTNTWTVYSIWSRGKALTYNTRYKDEPYAGKGIRHWFKQLENKR